MTDFRGGAIATTEHAGAKNRLDAAPTRIGDHLEKSCSQSEECVNGLEAILNRLRGPSPADSSLPTGAGRMETPLMATVERQARLVGEIGGLIRQIAELV